MIKGICPECGGDFESKSANHKFCSIECRENYNIKMRLKKEEKENRDKNSINFWLKKK